MKTLHNREDSDEDMVINKSELRQKLKDVVIRDICEEDEDENRRIP